MKTTQRTRRSWTLRLKVDGGHRYFADEAGRIAVADASGRYPEHTNDGVLWLDRDRPVCISLTGESTLPLLHEDGQQSCTIVSAIGGLRAATEFGLTVEFSDKTREFLDVLKACRASGAIILGD